MENYEDWYAKLQDKKINMIVGFVCATCFVIPMTWILFFHESVEPISTMMYFIYVFLLWMLYFFRKKYKESANSKEIYDFLLKEESKNLIKEKENQLKIKKDRQVASDNFRSKIEKSNASELNKLDELEKNIKSLQSLKLPSPLEFKSSLNSFESSLTSKIGVDGLQNFIRIGSFIDDVLQQLENSKKEIAKSVDIPFFKKQFIDDKIAEQKGDFNRVHEKITNMSNSLEGKGGGYGSDAEVAFKKLSKISDELIPLYKKELDKILYMDALAKSMIIFVTNDKNVMYLEILQAFEKLGALDSSWQKEIKKKLNNISAQLDVLIKGVVILNSNFEKLLDQNEVIISSIKELDDSVKMGNAIQALTAYQLYRINKNTKKIN